MASQQPFSENLSSIVPLPSHPIQEGRSSESLLSELFDRWHMQHSFQSEDLQTLSI